MAARLLRTAIIIAFVLSAKGAFSATTATTHYISKSLGADTNSGTSKTTPWAHLPGMAGCASNCASYSPVSGDSFILYGGDTWGAGDLGGVWWRWNGAYIGVDKTWFNSSVCGASWCRPIWDCQNTNCGDNSNTFNYNFYFDTSTSSNTLDNIEMKGYKYDGAGGHAGGQVGDDGTNNTVEHMYIHGWSHASGSCGSGTNDPYVISTTTAIGNVIDGSDSGDIGGLYCFGGMINTPFIEGNVIRYVYNGFNGSNTQFSGNLVEYNGDSTTGDHCNMVFIQKLTSGATVGYVYNNVIRHSVCSGGEPLWLLGNANCASCTMYAFNNVMYDMASGADPADIQVGNHPGNSGGPFYVYNNTLDAGGNTAIGNGECCQRFVTHISNNHIIHASAICNTAGTSCVEDGTELSQTVAQANANTSPHFDQYTTSETYAYSPVASTNSTVGTGTNHNSMCSGSLAALCSDTTYPEYNTTNHTVSMRSVNVRPTNGAWDIGAYQFLSSISTQPQSPTSLQVSVQ